MIGKDIEVDMLSSKEIQTLYDVFILYANGFMPKEFMEDTSSYDSPIVPWSSVGRIEYDEMTAYQLCRKASLTMEKIKKGLSSKELVVYRTEWLNYLLENQKICFQKSQIIKVLRLLENPVIEYCKMPAVAGV